MLPLSLILGTIVGFSLGLTGGGRTIFAVPLLVYGVAIDSRQAVGVSLFTVASTALVRFVQPRPAWRRQQSGDSEQQAEPL
jgi:uncharacterized protein